MRWNERYGRDRVETRNVVTAMIPETGGLAIAPNGQRREQGAIPDSSSTGDTVLEGRQQNVFRHGGNYG